MRALPLNCLRGSKPHAKLMYFIRRVLCRVPEGTVETILAYCHATLQDDTLDTITPYLQERGIGIVAASALSMGLLSNRVRPLRLLLTYIATHGVMLHLPMLQSQSMRVALPLASGSYPGDPCFCIACGCETPGNLFCASCKHALWDIQSEYDTAVGLCRTPWL